MKTQEVVDLKRVESALRSCLDTVPFLKIERISKASLKNGGTPDLTVSMKLPQGKRQVAVEFRSSGNPRFARDVVNNLVRFRQKNPDTLAVFAAPFISEASARICEEEGIGYLDLSGNCRLCFDQIFIERRGQPNLFAEKRDLRSLYSPKAERIVRVLLTHPKRSWKIKDLGREASVSIGLVAKAKNLLDEREWIKPAKEGFTLTNPEALLQEWGETYDFNRNRIRGFYTLMNQSEIEKELVNLADNSMIRFALTSFSAADRYAPTVRQNRVFIYLDKGEPILKQRLDLKEVPTGANVMLLTPYDEGVYYCSASIDEIPVVSPIQGYLDLIGNPGRGEEAAEAILEKAIKPRW